MSTSRQIPTYTFDYVRGDSTAIVFRITQQGTLVNFSGQTVVFSYQKDATTVVSLTGTETATGVLSFSPTTSDIDTVGDFDFDIQATNAGVVRTWVKGVIRVIGDVTP